MDTESQFYYPEEEGRSETESMNFDEGGGDEQVNKIHGFIYSLHRDNTEKKTAYNLNIWLRFRYVGWRDKRPRKHFSKRTEHSALQIFHGHP